MTLGICLIASMSMAQGKTAPQTEEELVSASILALRSREMRVADSTPSIIPVASEEYRLSCGLGWRPSPFTGSIEFHNGVDICARPGTPIITPADGRVIARGEWKYNGKFLRIDHGRGCMSTYAHLEGFAVQVGEKVNRGQVIGFMGNTGRSTGPHLHYTIAIDNIAKDPLAYMSNNRYGRDFLRVKREGLEDRQLPPLGVGGSAVDSE